MRLDATCTTKRQPAMSGGKRGEPTDNLSAVSITSPMLADTRGDWAVRQALGLEGSATQLFECYTESHLHTDSGTSVTQMPDIKAGDRLVCDSVTYNVEWAEIQAATISFGKTLQMLLSTDKRA